MQGKFLDVTRLKSTTMLPISENQPFKGGTTKLIFDQLKVDLDDSKTTQSITYFYRKPGSKKFDGTFTVTRLGWSIDWGNSEGDDGKYRFDEKSGIIYSNVNGVEKPFQGNKPAVLSKLKHIMAEIAGKRARMKTR